MSAVMKSAEPRADDSVYGALIQAAKDPAIDPQKARELYLIARDIRQDLAEEAFNDAMSLCQAEMRPIAADAENPQTRSRYASYAQLDRALRPIYTKHGFAISYDEADSNKGPDWVRCLAYVTRGAYMRTYRRDLPADGKGAKGGDVMTKTHASGAANSYGARYLLKGIFNVAVGEDDRDGNDPPKVAEAPAAYDSWKADMDVKAEDGKAAHLKAWQGSSEAFRRYAVAHDKAWWEASKKKAAKVEAP